VQLIRSVQTLRFTPPFCGLNEQAPRLLPNFLLEFPRGIRKKVFLNYAKYFYFTRTLTVAKKKFLLCDVNRLEISEISFWLFLKAGQKIKHQKTFFHFAVLE